MRHRLLERYFRWLEDDLASMLSFPGVPIFIAYCLIPDFHYWCLPHKITKVLQ